MDKLRFNCETCHRTLSVPPEAAGRRIRCPDCGTVQRAPAAANPPTTRPDMTRLAQTESVEQPGSKKPTAPVQAPPPEQPSADFAQREAAPGDDYRYEAFISYRHVEPDRQWAHWLHTSLETYRVPKKLVRERRLTARLKRVFRDEEELPASADLSKEIDRALEQSRFLIVVCSPRTPASEWVNKEVERFRELGRHDRILALLIEGEPGQAFPRALREIRRTITDPKGTSVERIEEVEPLAADVRPRLGKRTGGLRKMAKLRLLACVLGVRYDDLRQRDAERRLRFLAGAAVGVTALLLVLAVFAGIAIRERQLEQDKTRQLEKTSKLAAEKTEEAAAKVKETDDERKLRRWRQYLADMQQIQAAHDAGDAMKVNQLLTRQIPDPQSGLEDFRGVEWYYWNRQQNVVKLIQTGVTDCRSLAISPDGQTIAVADGAVISVWGLRNGQRRWQANIGSGDRAVWLEYPLRPWDQSVAFSPDGKWVAATCASGDRQARKGSFRVWDLASGAECLAVRDDPRLGGRAITFSPDSRVVVVGGSTATDTTTGKNLSFWKSWNCETRKPYVLSNHPTEPAGLRPQDNKNIGPFDPGVTELSFTPDGKELVTADLEGTASVWFWPEGRWNPTPVISVARYFGIGAGLALPWDSDSIDDILLQAGRPRANNGNQLPSTIRGGIVVAPTIVTDSQGRHATHRDFDSKANVVCLAQDARYLLGAGCDDGIVRVWSGRGLPGVGKAYIGATSDIKSIAFGPGVVGAVNARGDVRVWPLDDQSNTVVLPVLPQIAPHPYNDVRRSPDGKFEGKWIRNRKVFAIEHLTEQKTVAEIPTQHRPASVIFSLNSRFVALSFDNFSSDDRYKLEQLNTPPFFQLWDIQTNKLTATAPNTHGMGFSADSSLFVTTPGATIVSSPADGVAFVSILNGKGARFIRSETGEILSSIDFDLKKNGFNYLSPSGRYLAFTGNGFLDIYEVSTAKQVFHADVGAGQVQFDEGKHLIMAVVDSDKESVLVADLKTSKIVPTFFGRLANARIFFSADRRRAYVIGYNSLSVYSADGGTLLVTMKCEGTPDPNRLDEAIAMLIEQWK